jgi:coenzyme F420-0:L-glutamate ligase / coenzyme F420-1:gamma-L-glutamate ligase
MPALPAAAVEFLKESRIARLGTAGADGRPLVVPVCYAFDGARVFSAIDAKPKRAPGRDLKRIRNIRENPRVCLVVDHYEEDWRRLRYVIVHGLAELISDGREYAYAVDLLVAKYPQYRALALDRERGIVIGVTPEAVVDWSYTQ